MVVGGNSAENDVELVDLTGQGRNCEKPQNFPGGDHGTVGTFFKGKVIVCGGCCTYTSDCYFYNSGNGSWTEGPTMIEERSGAASVIMNDALWITGGTNSNGHHSSTEIFNSSNNSFGKYIDLPVEGWYHEIIKISDKTSMLIGGQKKDTYYFDGQLWTNGPNLIRGRYGSQAGLVTFPNGTKMVLVVGGFTKQTTEFLNLDDNSD